MGTRVGNSSEQLGKFSELNCKPLRISQCFCTESSGHPQRAGLATARLGTVGNSWEAPWEQPDLRDGMRVVSDHARARARVARACMARASADDGAPTLHLSALPFFHALSSRNCRWHCIRHDRNGVGRLTVGRHSLLGRAPGLWVVAGSAGAHEIAEIGARVFAFALGGGLVARRCPAHRHYLCRSKSI